ncbi:hypothetical protein phi18_203 [Bacillus phage phi18]|nr:hypothetical protein phi18_006 [Bacillus phage phi18]UAV84473.1 hypothetical protein phi18_203 [Bacillus phage phi18]
MNLKITHGDKTFVEDILSEPIAGAYVLYFSEYKLGSASVGEIDRVDDTGVLFLRSGSTVDLDQPYILLKEYIGVDDAIMQELGEAYDDDRIDADRGTFTSRAPRPAEQPPRELTSQERQLEQWTTTQRVFSHDLKKGVPYAIKHKHPEEVFYGLYSGLLNPVTALFRYLSGEYKVSVQQIEAGVVEIHEIVEDKEEF